jgi:RNA ligase
VFYEFPHDLTIDEVREVIARHNERTGTRAFIEADRGDYSIFNYLVAFADSFPTPNTGDAALDREYAILRECRGLTMCRKTGRVLNRKYAKFFNVNEKPETQVGLIDFSLPHVLIEKLDGSMITPLYTGEPDDITPESLIWCTKMGATDVAIPVIEFVAQHPHYANWAAMTLAAGYTPIFEWCSRQQKIVVDYPEDRLVLTAIRHNRTGEILPYKALEAAARSGIDIARVLPGSAENIEKFMAEVQDMEGEEGYIIRFDTGHMLKVKGAWYCQLHRSKEMLQFEKDVLALILEDRLDDAKAFMDDADRDRVDRYDTALAVEITKTAQRLADIVSGAREALGGDKKAFAVDFLRSRDWAPHETPLLFTLWDGHDAEQAVRTLLAKNVSTQPKVETVRHLIGGLNWKDYRDSTVKLDD